MAKSIEITPCNDSDRFQVRVGKAFSFIVNVEYTDGGCFDHSFYYASSVGQTLREWGMVEKVDDAISNYLELT